MFKAAAVALATAVVILVGDQPAVALDPTIAEEISVLQRPDLLVPGPPAGRLDVNVVTTADDPVAGPSEMTLRRAVGLASALGGTVAVNLEPGGQYTLGCGTGEDSNDDGDLDYTGDGTLVVQGHGASISPESILCSPDRLLHAPNGGAIVLVDVVLTGGSALGDGGAVLGDRVSLFDVEVSSNTSIGGRGGAVFANSSLLVVRSNFDANEALAYGTSPRGVGGAAMSAGTAAVYDSHFVSNSAVYDGGALAITGSSPAVIAGTTFESNTTDFGRGGAVFVGGGANIVIVECLFTLNRAEATTAGGGALYVDGALEVYDTTFTANQSFSLPITPILALGGGGGAVYSEGTLVVVGGAFDGNRSGVVGAGGAISHKGSLTMANTTLRENSSGGAGGAVFAGGGRSESDHITIDSSLLTDNKSRLAGGGALFLSSTGDISVSRSRITANQAMHTGASGGGILVNGNAIIERTTIDDNRAHHAGSGGGVHADVGSTATIVNSTIADNWAGVGGGIGADTSPSGGVRIRHSTIAGNGAIAGSNLAIGSLLQISGSIVSEPVGTSSCALRVRPVSDGGNVDGDGSCGFDDPNDVAGVDEPVTAGLVEMDGVAVRVPIAGVALDLLREACVDAGLDQLGTARGDACDAGAVEVPGLSAVDDVVIVHNVGRVVVDLLANDEVGTKPILARFTTIHPIDGVRVSGGPRELVIGVRDRAVGGTIGTYEICLADGTGCSEANIELDVIERNIEPAGLDR